MGLNLETLIGILIILILLILGDGVRRMLRERRNRLRFRLDPRFSAQQEAETEQLNPELPGGGARVVGQAPPRASSPEREEASPAQAETPPVMMEPDDPPVEARDAEQPDLFAAGKQAGTEPEPAQTPDAGEILEVLVVNLVADRGQPFQGRELLQQLLEQGMRFGEMNIFHRHQREDGRDQLMFSMANAVEPGTFDIDEMEKEDFRAVTFFLKLPGPSRPQDALDRMMATARKLATALNGELRDEQHSVLTPQTIEHFRQRVQEFERRKRVPHGQ